MCLSLQILRSFFGSQVQGVSLSEGLMQIDPSQFHGLVTIAFELWTWILNVEKTKGVNHLAESSMYCKACLDRQARSKAFRAIVKLAALARAQTAMGLPATMLQKKAIKSSARIVFQSYFQAWPLTPHWCSTLYIFISCYLILSLLLGKLFLSQHLKGDSSAHSTLLSYPPVVASRSAKWPLNKQMLTVRDMVGDDA